MNKDRGQKETGGEASRPRTEGGDVAQRARSFFDRASERARRAARDIGQRVRGDEREREPYRYRGQEVMDEGSFTRPDRDRLLNRAGRDFGGHMGRDQSYPSFGGREPQHYGQEQYRSRERGYGMRDEYAPRMYGGREGREWMRDDRDRDYSRDSGREDDRGIRANLGGGYRMTSDRGTVRDPMGDWGSDRDDNRFERDDRSRDRRW